MEEAESNEKTNVSRVWFLLQRERERDREKKTNSLQNGKVFLLQETETEAETT